jgi:hypothetical protein
MIQEKEGEFKNHLSFLFTEINRNISMKSSKHGVNISVNIPAGSVMLTEPVIFFVTNQTTGSIYNIEPA